MQLRSKWLKLPQTTALINAIITLARSTIIVLKHHNIYDKDIVHFVLITL